MNRRDDPTTDRGCPTNAAAFRLSFGRVIAAGALALLCLVSGPAGAQQAAYPNRPVRLIVAQPDIAERLVELGGVPAGNAPAEFAQQIRDQVPLFRELVDMSGLKPQ